jgi:hypothetical protein
LKAKNEAMERIRTGASHLPDTTTLSMTTTTSQSKKALPTSTHCYSGKLNEDLEEWIFVISQNLKIADISRVEDKVSAIANFVKGNPTKMLRNYKQNAGVKRIDEYFAMLLKSRPRSNIKTS